MKRAWTLRELLAHPDLAGGRLLLRADSKGKVVDALYAVPRTAKEVGELMAGPDAPPVDATSVVLLWSNARRLRASPQDLPLQVGFTGSAELLGWDPLGLIEREKLGLLTQQRAEA